MIVPGSFARVTGKVQSMCYLHINSLDTHAKAGKKLLNLLVSISTAKM